MGRNMRSWVEQLGDEGELIKIDMEVDAKADMSAFLCQSKEKALLFENAKGHSGWKVLGQAPINMRNAGLAFGSIFPAHSNLLGVPAPFFKPPFFYLRVEPILWPLSF